MRRRRVVALTWGLAASWAAAGTAAPAAAQGADELAVRLDPPGSLSEGDRAQVVARVTGAGPHPVLVTPRSEGTAVEVVRGRLMRAEARDPEADELEFRIPVVAHGAGTAVLRVEVSGYACAERCRNVRAEGRAILHVTPARRSRRAGDEGDEKAPKQVADARRRDGRGADDGSGRTNDGADTGADRADMGADRTGDGAEGTDVGAGGTDDGAGRTDGAGARRSSLSWVRMPDAEGCLASAPLARAVEAQLGRRVFVSASRADLAVEGRAERADGAWRAVIQVTDATGAVLGERTLESRAEACEELGEMTTVAVALMIDPLTAPEAPADAGRSSNGSPEPEVIVRTERVEVPVPTESERPRWRVEIDAVLVGSLGLSPLPNLGGLSAVIVEPPGFVPLVLEGALFPFSRAERAGAHADFLHVHAGLQICPLGLREGGLALHGCLGADAGAVIVLGGDLPVDQSERLIGQGHVALRGHWDVVGPLTVRLGLHFLVPFRQDDPFTTGANPFYTPEPVAGMVDLGAGVHFD
ncbi:MAG TPA: hypothetical protein RMH99_05230 [Sandaracinaceae bacterium LLY-WYZ-13_1]|nr:hypothetical protein [Sandaracinaceae bacterium LLY-WYZ-13_1]